MTDSPSQPPAEPVRRCKHDVSEDCPACMSERIQELEAALLEQQAEGIESNRLAADNFRRAKVAEAALRLAKYALSKASLTDNERIADAQIVINRALPQPSGLARAEQERGK